MPLHTDYSRSSSRPRLLLLPLLALLHLGLWVGLDSRFHPAAPKTDEPRRSELRLLTLRLPPLLKPVALPPRPAPALPRRAEVQPPRPSAVLPVTPVAETVIPTPAPVPASPAAPPTSLLASEATRRALRAAAKSPLLSERAALAMGDGPPLRPEEALGQQMKNAAIGDCLKGEFAGGGAGLLSLPFWLLAEARGKCSR